MRAGVARAGSKPEIQIGTESRGGAIGCLEAPSSTTALRRRGMIVAQLPSATSH